MLLQLLYLEAINKNKNLYIKEKQLQINQHQEDTKLMMKILMMKNNIRDLSKLLRTFNLYMIMQIEMEQNMVIHKLVILKMEINYLQMILLNGNDSFSLLLYLQGKKL